MQVFLETGRLVLRRFTPAGGAAGDVELGYGLRRSAWGQGYATERSRALIRKGFAELGVQRVVAETMAVRGRPGRPGMRPARAGPAGPRRARPVSPPGSGAWP